MNSRGRGGSSVAVEAVEAVEAVAEAGVAVAAAVQWQQ